MTTDADISPDKEASFNSLVEERGGPGKFTDFQLDVALAVVGMMGDIRSERYGTPVERARTAEAAARLLELLPPPKPQSRESGRPSITTGMSLQDMANEYARAVADLDTTPDWDLEERPIIDAVAEPAPAPPPPARAPEPAPPPQRTAAAPNAAVWPPVAAVAPPTEYRRLDEVASGPPTAPRDDVREVGRLYVPDPPPPPPPRQPPRTPAFWEVAMSHWFRRIIGNVLSRAAPAVENSHSANSEVRMSWSRHITCDVLSRAGASSQLPHGPTYIPCRTSASDYVAARPLPAARRTKPMFIPVSQRSPSDIEP